MDQEYRVVIQYKGITDIQLLMASSEKQAKKCIRLLPGKNPLKVTAEVYKDWLLFDGKRSKPKETNRVDEEKHQRG